MVTDTTTADDLQLLRDTVRNIARLASAINEIAAQLQDVIIHVKYDDSLIRAVESIADTLARMERQ